MKTRSKKSLVGLLAALLSFIAKAYIWIIISIACVVVGVIVIVKLIQCIKHLWPNDPPPQGQPTNVLRVIESNQFIYDNSSAGPAPNVVPLQQVNSTNGFVFQYCMDSRVWMVPGTGYDDTISQTENNPTNCVFILCSGGQKLQFSSADGGATWYDVEVLDNDTTTYWPVVERSTNQQAWDPIFTNFGCMKYDVQTFTDTNPPLPQAYYRIRWQ